MKGSNSIILNKFIEGGVENHLTKKLSKLAQRTTLAELQFVNFMSECAPDSKCAFESAHCIKKNFTFQEAGTAYKKINAS